MRPLVEELIPCPDPWDVVRKLAHLPHLLFLDSSDRHAERGRYSYVMADPVQFLDLNEQTIRDIANDPFEALFNIRFDSEAVQGLPPFQGGWAGLWGYELNQFLERVPGRSYRHDSPSCYAVGRYESVFAFDHVQERAWLIARDGFL